MGLFGKSKKDKVSKTFVVFEDLAGKRKVTIHRKTCQMYQIMIMVVQPETNKWHEVDDLKTAQILAEQISKKYGIGWTYCGMCPEFE
jgi:hypothetical protein